MLFNNKINTQASIIIDYNVQKTLLGVELETGTIFELVVTLTTRLMSTKNEEKQFLL